MEINEKSDADKFVEQLITEGAKEGIDHTIPLETPPFYNEELYNKGRKYYFNYLYPIFGSHLCGLISVLSIPSILTILVATKGSSTVAKAYRRYLQTIFHVVTWMSHPLKPGTPAWKSLDIVRKIHSRVSKKCENTINAKITQKDLALTQFAFVAYFSMHAELIAEEERSEVLEAWIHYWRVNGHLMGIKEKYNTCVGTWETVKPRFIALREQVFRPHLENTDEEFEKNTKNLVDGLWFFSPGLTIGSALFLTKWFAGCNGYQYFESDFKDGATKTNTKLAYYELGWYDRFLVATGLFVTHTLWKYPIMQWYLNLRVKLTVLMSQKIPLLAAYKFGFKWAFVNIFDKDQTPHLHED